MAQKSIAVGESTPTPMGYVPVGSLWTASKTSSKRPRRTYAGKRRDPQRRGRGTALPVAREGAGPSGWTSVAATGRKKADGRKAERIDLEQSRSWAPL